MFLQTILKLNNRYIFIICLFIFPWCDKPQKNDAISVLTNYFKSVSEQKFENAITYVDSSYRAEMATYLVYEKTEFYKNVTIVKIDTIDYFFKVQTCHNERIPYIWWLKQTENGARIIIARSEFTQNWKKLEKQYVIYNFSPNLTSDFIDNKSTEVVHALNKFLTQIITLLDAPSEKKIEYYLFSSFEDMAEITGLSAKTIISGRFSFSTKNGKIYTVKEIDTLTIISSIFKKIAPRVRAFFPIGFYIGYLKDNKWNGLSTHFWTAAYDKDTILYPIVDLMQGKQNMCVKQHPDVSWLIAGSFCDFIISNYGVDKYIQLAQLWSPKLNSDSLFTQLFDSSLDNIEQKWIKYATIKAGSHWQDFEISKKMHNNFLEIEYCVELESLVIPLSKQFFSTAEDLADLLSADIVYPVNAYFLTLMLGYKKIPGWQSLGSTDANYQIFIKSHITGDDMESEREVIFAAFVHELVHLFLQRKTTMDTSLPKWFDEGLAYYITSLKFPRHSPVNVLNRVELTLRERKPLYKLEELKGKWIPENGIYDPILAVHESYMFVKYLVENYGWEKLRLLLNNCWRYRTDFEKAFIRSYGVSLKTVENKWKKEITDVGSNLE